MADDDARWLAEMKRRDAERAHDRLDATVDQLNSAAVGAGTIALRTIVFVNGGAAAAILAFSGGLVAQGGATIQDLGAVTQSLTWFAVGVAFALIGMGFAYFVNYAHSSAMGSYDKTWNHPYFQSGTTTSTWRTLAIICQIVAVLAGLAAVIVFVLGILDVRQAITQLGATSSG